MYPKAQPTTMPASLHMLVGILGGRAACTGRRSASVLTLTNGIQAGLLANRRRCLEEQNR